MTDTPDESPADESYLRLDLPVPLDAEMEEKFKEICTRVREEIDILWEKGDSSGVRSYGVELLREIDGQRQSGFLTEEEYQYLLAAANDIMDMEIIFFRNRFLTF